MMMGVSIGENVQVVYDRVEVATMLSSVNGPSIGLFIDKDFDIANERKHVLGITFDLGADDLFVGSHNGYRRRSEPVTVLIDDGSKWEFSVVVLNGDPRPHLSVGPQCDLIPIPIDGEVESSHVSRGGEYVVEVELDWDTIVWVNLYERFPEVDVVDNTI